jgi:glycosyltransferase involved in cell wall biosynthesis
VLIGIDVSMVDSNKAGIGYLTYSIVESLARLDKDNSYLLYTHNVNNLVDLTLPRNFKIVEIKQAKANLKWILRVHLDFNNRKIDRFISTSNLMFGVLFPYTITFIQDLSQIKYPQFFSKKGRIIFRVLLNMLLRREKIIVTTSNAVREEVIAYYPGAKNKTFAVGAGLQKWTQEQITNDKLQNIKDKYSLSERYFLSVSTLEPRKNYINVIKAFAVFSKDYPEYKYLIAGKKGWFYEEIFQTVKSLNLENKVQFLGYVSDEDLPVLYHLSSGVIYLSFYEGFGLPVIEAYSRGVPSLVSDIEVFREIAQENTVFADPINIEDIVRKMKILINQNKFTPSSEILTSFSWDKTAIKLMGLYQADN